MKNQKYRVIIAVLSAAVVLSVCAALYAFFGRDGKTYIPPDFAPANEPQISSLGDEGTPAEHMDGGGSVTLTYSDKVTIDLNTGKISMMFSNTSKSAVDLFLQLVINDKIAAESGLVKAGYKLTEMKLDENVVLEKGGYDGEFHVYFYDATTGERSVLNSVVQVEITAE